MNLGDYQNLKKDAEFYMKDFISKYNLKVSQKHPIDVEPEVFLENNEFLIRLATAETFPYSDVTFCVKKKNKGECKEIKESEIFLKFSISEKQFTKQWLEIDNSIDYPIDNKFSVYQQAILRIKTIIEKYYIPIINDPARAHLA